MINVAIVGSSGYSGAELVRLLSRHPDVVLTHLFVSENSADRMQPISALYGQLSGLCALPLEPLSIESAAALTAEDCDVIFLATDHRVSHDLAPVLIENGIVVIDLSGAFRIKDEDKFERFYGFALGAAQHELMAERVYGLVDWVKREDLQQAQLISMPGCYPTASQLALKPLCANAELGIKGLLDEDMPPVINAVSGVSGAGRKAKLSNSFCEVSLNAYGLFSHRHLIEIEEQLGTKVIFNPHLGNFKRGILATITARLKPSVRAEDVQNAYLRAYPQALSQMQNEVLSKALGQDADLKAKSTFNSLVRLKQGTVKLSDVQNTPFCDISFVVDGKYIVISSAIDNLLKGAASQAIEAMNLHFGLPRTRCLL